MITTAFLEKKVGKHFPKSWIELPTMYKSDYQKRIETLISKGFNKSNVT